jgi:hypothetical protein
VIRADLGKMMSRETGGRFRGALFVDVSALWFAHFQAVELRTTRRESAMGR